MSIKKNVDVQPGVGVPAIFHCSQGDKGTRIILGLLNNNDSYTIPEGTTAIIRGSRADGTLFTEITADIDTTTEIKFNLTEDMTSVPGPVECEAVMTSGTANVIGTANFIVNVEKSPASVGSVFPGTDAAETWLVNELTNLDISGLDDESVVDAINSKLGGTFETTDAGKVLTVNQDGTVSPAAVDLSGKANESTIAPEFDTSAPYTAGQYVYNNGVLYRFTADHSAGAWTGTDAETVTVGGEVEEVKSTVDEITETHTITPVNLLNFNDANFVTGKYINPTWGTLSDNASYNTSGYIPVEAGETYTYTHGVPVGTARLINFLAAYDANKNFMSGKGGSSLNTYTVPSGVSFVRFSATAQYFNASNGTCMFYKGTSIDSYHEYFEPYVETQVSNDALDGNYINGLIDAKIDHFKTDYGTTIKSEVASLSSDNALTLASYIDNEKNVVYEFLGYFSTFDSLSIGHGYNITYGSYVTVDNTNITVYYGNAQQQAQQAHGLEISEFLHVVVTQRQTAYADIEIITASGSYKLTGALWRGCIGDIFARVGVSMTDCVFSVTFKDFNEDVFLFGDSYVTIGDPSKYVYYLNSNGYTHLMIDGYGGRNATNGLVSFENVIDIAVPKYAIWALGMNNSDSSSAINSNWVTATTSFLNACAEKGITPILATIPNTPTQLNTFKNAWVKSNGARYIDFAKAVGAESAGSQWFTGMLSSDNVHPTELGAKALYARFLSDVPEVIK